MAIKDLLHRNQEKGTISRRKYLKYVACAAFATLAGACATGPTQEPSPTKLPTQVVPTLPATQAPPPPTPTGIVPSATSAPVTATEKPPTVAPPSSPIVPRSLVTATPTGGSKERKVHLDQKYFLTIHMTGKLIFLLMTKAS